MAPEKSETESEKRELKRLGFVRVAAVQALVCVSNLYGYAKQNSGPLRSTVATVENAVSAVVGPVYDKFKGVPDDILSFLDTKVDEATHKFDEHAPPKAKKIVNTAQSLTEKAAEKVRNFVNEAQTSGLRAAVSYAANESKHLAVDGTASIWIKLNKTPSSKALSEKVGPTIAVLSKKYNSVVVDLTQKGYPVVGYLPLVPVDEISKAIERNEETKKDGSDEVPVNKSDSSDSD